LENRPVVGSREERNGMTLDANTIELLILLTIIRRP